MESIAQSHPPPLASLLARISDVDGCWEWTGPRTRDGYPLIGHKVAGEMYAHRATYVLMVGPIKPGLELDHGCRNRACINPAHLEPVTHRENTLRSTGPTAVNAVKTHCVHGHALTGDNLWIRRRGEREERFCKTCRREGMRRLNARKKAA